MLRIAPDFRSYSRRANGRIAGYGTVVATQKTVEKTSWLESGVKIPIHYPFSGSGKEACREERNAGDSIKCHDG